MKVFVQIPCYNEEHTLEQTIKDIPRKIPGVDQVLILVSDDGSTDGTIEKAKELGVDYIVTHRRNMGLARNFQSAVEACLHLGADIIVNTDGDNQYRGDHIPRLVKPILDGEADFVVGCRDIKGHEEFSPIKKSLQLLGSRAVSLLSNTNIPDATSGFRAFHRDAAMQLNVLNRFSYTIETLIQAGNSDVRVGYAQIGVNKKTRESRLFKSIPEFVSRQLSTMLRMFLFYSPVKFFAALTSVCFILAFLFGLRVIYHAYFIPPEDWTIKIGTLAISGIFTILGFFTMTMGVIGSNLASTRQMLTKMQVQMRHEALSKKLPPSLHIIDCAKEREKNRKV